MPIADMAVLVPSRGRPENAKRLLEAIHRTAKGRTHVLFGVDQDDGRLKDYIAFRKGDLLSGDSVYTSAERQNLVKWTNGLAKMTAGKYRYYASFGDDMIPRTPGWDLKLMGAIEDDFGGIGISYPWDGIRDDIPEAYVLSSSIAQVLGWIMMPKLNHWYNDNVIADLGREAGCIRQLRGVVVDHMNVGTGRASVDQTAIDQGAKIAEDKSIYEEWRRDEMWGSVARIKTLRMANESVASRS